MASEAIYLGSSPGGTAIVMIITTTAECGTYSGYIMHNRNKQIPCSPCRLAMNTYRREKLRSDNAALGYNPRRFRKHSITKEFHDKMLEKYEGKCWICKDKEAIHIDHDHNCCPGYLKSCGKCIRGLLCSNYNTAIGLLRDDVLLLKEAVKYLKQPTVY